MKRKYKKNVIYHKRYKLSKRFKISKRYKISNYYIKRNFKILLILFIILIYFIFYSKQNYAKKIQTYQIYNNNWIKKDMTEFINNYLSNFKGINDSEIVNDNNSIEEFFSLKVMVKEENSILNLETKEKLREELSRRMNKNFSLVKNIFITGGTNFGNQIFQFNNLIYYSEILGIKNIYLNSGYNWYIKNDIYTNKIHISLISRNLINCDSKETFCVSTIYFHSQIIVKSERRSMILKDEIKRNLPKIITKKNDLYIYIRSGDSFKIGGNRYPQAPYCFYQKVISEFKFDDIYLIAQDDKSPVTQKLLKDYPKIKHSLNSWQVDVATLMYAYNLVNAFSSFSLAAITFNDNLINLFEYEQMHIRMFIDHFHFSFDKLERKFNIYRMKPDKDFFVKMFVWRNTDEQRKLLFEEHCKYEFKRSDSTKSTIFDS